MTKRGVTLLVSIVCLVLMSYLVSGAVVSHTLSEITPINTNLVMEGYNITAISKVGIGTSTPGEELTVVGRASVTSDPDSDDDVGDRGYYDIRYSSFNHDSDHAGVYMYDRKEAPILSSRLSDSGFYYTTSASKGNYWPETTNDDYGLINCQHSNLANNYAMQFAGDLVNDNDLYYRSTNNVGTAAWQKVWTSNSDGTGTGLYAGDLDGLSSGSFLRSDIATIAYQRITLTGGMVIESSTQGLAIDDDTVASNPGAGNVLVEDGPMNICDNECSSRTTTDGNMYVEGKIGIGTTSPSSLIQVGSTGTTSTYISATGYQAAYLLGTSVGAYGIASDNSGWNYGINAYGRGTSSNLARAVQSYVSRGGSGVHYSGYFVDSGTLSTYYGLYADIRSGDAIDIAENIYDYYNETEAADLVIAGPGNETLMLTNISYNQRVIGVITTKPHMVMGAELVKNRTNFANDVVRLALSGRVPVKVTEENGVIMPGDLLTSSTTPGHAMKWGLLDVNTAQTFEEFKSIIAENEMREHAIIGKALSYEEDGKVIVQLGLQ